MDWDEVLYWAFRCLGPEFKGPTEEDPLGSLPIPLKTAFLERLGERLGLEFDLAEGTLTRGPNAGRSYTYAPYWWTQWEGHKELLYSEISQASESYEKLPPFAFQALGEFIDRYGLHGEEHYAERLFLTKVFLPLFGTEGLSLLRPQFGFQDEEGNSRRADFLLQGRRLYAIEIEGRTYHERPQRFADEKLRQRSLVLRGIDYYPIAFEDIRSGQAQRTLIKLAEQDPILASHLKTQGEVQGSGAGSRIYPHGWLVDFPARYPAVLKGAFARLIQGMEQGEALIQVLDPGSTTPLVEGAFADAYFTLRNVARLAGVELPLPEVRIYRSKTNEVSERFRQLLPLWTGEPGGFSVAEEVPEEGKGVEVFSWEKIVSLAEEAEAFKEAYEGRYGVRIPQFTERGESALALDFFARKFFPVPELKEAQLRLLRKALKGESGLALLPTGYGKSLVFQLFALLVPGVTLVISPLRALMRDQVYNLRRIGVTSAESISSDDEATAKQAKTEELLRGGYRIVYLSPERLRIKGFADQLRKSLGNIPIGALAVDEAHCVSEWGHDFRPAYLHIRRFYKEIQEGKQRKIPLIALTATASPLVRKDILRVLGLPEDAVEQLASSDRPNLSFSVHKTFNGIQGKRRILRELLTATLPKTLEIPKGALLGGKDGAFYPHAGVIFAVYADPKGKNTYEEGVHAIRDFLVEEGIVPSKKRVGVYASKKPLLCPRCGSAKVGSAREEKQAKCLQCDLVFDRKRVSDWDERMRKVQDRFQENRFPLLVATKGYGMGIDKRNIRYIVHHAMSSGLEGYYQEAGRAGRDGKHAHVALIFAPPTERCLKEHIMPGEERPTSGGGRPPCLSGNVLGFCPYGLTSPCDYAHQFSLFQSNYPGVDKSVERAVRTAKEVIEAKEEQGGWRIIEKPWGADSTDRFEFDLVRLLQIGLITDYVVEYASRKVRFYLSKPRISGQVFGRVRNYV